MAAVECGGFLFYSNFDSGNLAKVELVPKNESAVVTVNRNGKDVLEIPDLEFNIWTKPDCVGTEYENGNRTWFHFGIKGYIPCILVKLNLVDLNRQAKMYSQGMAPVYRLVPGRPNWERIRDKTTYTIADNVFTLSFKYRTPENLDAVTYFAFTYPYTYTELQHSLENIDSRFLSKPNSSTYDDIYYVRECICKSLEDRRIDLITISSYYNITNERETRLKYLFPYENEERPFKFTNKKIIFVSARVHPGETPSSFVFNGLLNLLLHRDDPNAIVLRRMYVFKMIPFLNPDGVVRGHYRTDTRGVNLNRMYLNPTLAEHPSVYAARALLKYYHSGFEEQTAEEENENNALSFHVDNNKMAEQVQVLSLEEKKNLLKRRSDPWCDKWKSTCRNCNTAFTSDDGEEVSIPRQHSSLTDLCSICRESQTDSGLFLYIDMHGHASKKGIFMYGNHFDDVERNVECMLLPKIMSLNNHNFHFTACNFTERNMYLRDRRDGMSREGSGRVAVLKLTGLIHSYTLECNYNTGRIVNVLPPTVREGSNKPVHTLPLPPKYTPHLFEEVGRALAASILDLNGQNPNSRIPNSEFHSLAGLREWLRVNCLNEIGMNRIVGRTKLPAAHNQSTSKQIRCKSMKSLGVRSRPNTSKSNIKKLVNKGCSSNVPVERKENFLSKDSNFTSQTSTSHAAPTTVSRIFNRSTSRNKSISQRSKTKRDNGQRNRIRTVTIDNSPITTSARSVQNSASLLHKFKPESESVQLKENSKLIKLTDNTTDRLKLREICFIKENRTKKLIAKFKSPDSDKQNSHDDDDDLVVAWGTDFTPKIISKQTDRAQSSSSKYIPYKNVEPSTSGKQIIRCNYKANNFASTKSKRTKGTLRRLTSASSETVCKIDKLKKRKKLKSKIL